MLHLVANTSDLIRDIRRLVLLIPYYVMYTKRIVPVSVCIFQDTSNHDACGEDYCLS